MDAFLTIGSGGIRSVLTQLIGEQGIGVFRLRLRFEWTPARLEGVEGAGIIFDGHLGVGFSGGPARTVGVVQSLYPIVFPSRQQGSAQVAELAMDMSLVQLHAIERERDGGPVTLQLHLQGRLLRTQASQPPSDLVDNTTFWGDLRYDLKPAQWFEILEQWGYAKSFLVQVPTYGSQDAPRSRAAVRELEKGVTALVDGRYRDAVAACRDGLEAAYGAQDKMLFPDIGYRVEKLREAGIKVDAGCREAEARRLIGRLQEIQIDVRLRPRCSVIRSREELRRAVASKVAPGGRPPARPAG